MEVDATRVIDQLTMQVGRLARDLAVAQALADTLVEQNDRLLARLEGDDDRE